ncbi:techylectin-5A-like [Oratosquilla oratoria]|uniref:techylectin-5A-like n=1 Tax=Oratosquilla oratoria TaxID=337810 RepID=UPI003F759BAA
MAVVNVFWVIVGIFAYSSPCNSHQLSPSSVSSLLELAGFTAPCVSRALAQCHEDSNPLASDPTALAEVHNLTHTIHQLVDAIQVLQNTSQPSTDPQQLSKPRNCHDLKISGDFISGLRRIFPFPCCPDRAINVFCDQVTDGGGWTIIQRRGDFPPYLDFFRTWTEYQRGFGDLNQEFWLGLDNIHQLTSESLQELRVDLGDFDNATRWAEYGFFHVGNVESKYKLSCGRYKGDAGDNLSSHNGMKFSTKDADNDIHNAANCAEAHLGAWWYTKCHASNLNGKYLQGETKENADGVIWHAWRGYYYSLRTVEMKIRPAFPDM